MKHDLDLIRFKSARIPFSSLIIWCLESQFSYFIHEHGVLYRQGRTSQWAWHEKNYYNQLSNTSNWLCQSKKESIAKLLVSMKGKFVVQHIKYLHSWKCLICGNILSQNHTCCLTIQWKRAGQREIVLGIILSCQFFQFRLQIYAFPTPSSHPTNRKWEQETSENTSKKHPNKKTMNRQRGKHFHREGERPINDDRLAELLSLGQNLIKLVTIFDGLHLYNIGSSHIWPKSLYSQVPLLRLPPLSSPINSKPRRPWPKQTTPTTRQLILWVSEKHFSVHNMGICSQNRHSLESILHFLKTLLRKDWINRGRRGV